MSSLQCSSPTAPTLAPPTWNFNGLHFISTRVSVRLSVCTSSGLAHVLAAVLSSLAGPLCMHQDVHSVTIVKWAEHRLPELRSAHFHCRAACPSRGRFSWGVGEKDACWRHPCQSLWLGNFPLGLKLVLRLAHARSHPLYLVGRRSGRWQAGLGRCCPGGRAVTGTRCSQPHSEAPCSQAGRGS